MPIARSDWLRVAVSVVDPDYWRGRAAIDTAYGWYVSRAAEALQDALTSSASSSAILVGHSAGGWLARALLGSSADARAATAALVTLGTPHVPRSPGRCVTGGALVRRVGE